MKNLLKPSIKPLLFAMSVLLIFACEKLEVQPEHPVEIKDSPDRNSSIIIDDIIILLPNVFGTGSYTSPVRDYYFTRNGIKYEGRYCYPSNKSGKYPLAIIMHGGGYNNKDYTALQRHLAKHGIASASLKWKADGWGYENEAEPYMIKHINWLFNSYYRSKDKLSNSVALIGHSLGGGVVVRYADEVENATGKDIRAIISLAPAVQFDMNQTHALNSVKSLLVMYSANDEDRDGAKNGAGISVSGFKFYDDAGFEGSNFWTSVTKDMIYFKNAKHKAYSDKVRCNYGLGCNVDLNNTINGYILANLRVHLENHVIYNRYFKHQERSSHMPYNGEFYQQHSDPIKSVLANFENNSNSTNTAGGSITKSGGIITLLTGNSWQIDSRSPHHTKAMRITWNKPSVFNPEIRMSYPGVFNATNYKYISIRVAQIFGNIYNQENVNQDFYVRFKDGNNHYSTAQKISNYGVIPYPPEVFSSNIFGNGEEVTRNAMTSTLIPLKHFKNIDMSKVKEVILTFGVPGHESGAVIIDNVEFYK